MTENLFWDPYTSRAHALEFLKSVVEPHPWFQAICWDGVPVGAVTFDVGRGRAMRRAELGYVLAKQYWGKGIASEATRQALKKGFAGLDVVRIEAYVDPENIGSVRVLAKAGLKKEAILEKYVVQRGRIRDRLIFAKVNRAAT